jgi:hypothetical protein
VYKGLGFDRDKEIDEFSRISPGVLGAPEMVCFSFVVSNSKSTKSTNGI